jgi:hypothetical protein
VVVAADHRTDRRGGRLPAARHAATGERCWPTDELAVRVGLGGNRSKLWMSLDRLDRFGVATFVATDTLTIRLWLPALTHRQLARLPNVMAVAYHQRKAIA